MKSNRNNPNRLLCTRNLVIMGMLSALATVLMFIQIQLPFVPPFYKLDAGDLPILIGAFAISPAAGLVMEFMKNLLHVIISGTDTAFIGDIANFLSGAIFVYTAAMIYHHKKSKKMAFISLIVATLVMSVASCFINAYITLPAYIGASGGHLTMDIILSAGKEKNGLVTNLYTFLVFAVLPFNFIKCTVVSVITCVIYKYISPLLKGSSSVRRDIKLASSQKK